MNGISVADAREMVNGPMVWYRTSWGSVEVGIITRVLGMGHVEIVGPAGSIVTSVQNVSKRLGD